jgi:hypothetical protein
VRKSGRKIAEDGAHHEGVVTAVDWRNPAPTGALRQSKQMRCHRGEVGMIWGALEWRRTEGGAKMASGAR